MTKRIFQSICVVAVTVLLATLILIMGVLYDYFSRVQNEQLSDQADMAAKGMAGQGVDFFQGLDLDGCRISWIAADGRVLYDNMGDAESMENHLNREEVREAMETGRGESSRYSHTLTQKLSYQARLLPDGTVIRLAVSKYPVWVLMMGVLLLAVTVPDYLLARPIAMAHPRAHAILLAAVAKDIALAVLCSVLTELGRLMLPVGITIAAFTSVGYLIDLYHMECDPIDDPIRYGVFCCFFGKLPIGPIVSAQQFIPQLEHLQMTAEGITRGMVQFLRGLAKIVILAASLQQLIAQWETLLSLQVTVLGSWLHVLCYIFYIYFTLSGYSDMARGTGAIFGLDLPENFHHPLQSSSVADFFGRFNISANRFVRKYVYQALGAEDNGPLSTSVNILLITMLMGLWYGINLNYLVWGAFLGLFIIFEVLYIERHVEKIPPYLCRLYTFIAILISFCWYCGSSLSASAASLRVMLGLGGAAAANQSCLYLLQTHWLLLLASAYLCSGAATPLMARFTRRWPGLSHAVTLVWNLILLATSLAFLL